MNSKLTPFLLFMVGTDYLSVAAYAEAIPTHHVLLKDRVSLNWSFLLVFGNCIYSTA